MRMGPAVNHTKGWPAVVELVGPPGAGKTTLLLSLCARSDGVRSVHIYFRPRNLVAWLRSVLSLIPVVLARSPGEMYRHKQSIWMIRLEAALAIVRRALKKASVVIFDQGPVFTMVRLREACPDGARGGVFQPWLDRKVCTWGEMLDAIVFLDAPDEVLLRRIRNRSKPHPIKAKSERKARETLASDRALYELLIEELCSLGRARVLRFDTNHSPPELLAAEIMSILGLTGASRGSDGMDELGSTSQPQETERS
jgi:shikimate kinase